MGSFPGVERLLGQGFPCGFPQSISQDRRQHDRTFHEGDRIRQVGQGALAEALRQGDLERIVMPDPLEPGIGRWISATACFSPFTATSGLALIHQGRRNLRANS